MKSIDNIKSKISSSLNGYSTQVRHALREKAIEQVKVKIALNERNIADFSQDELEIMVKDEEEKIKSKYKNTLGIGLLAFLGLS